MCELLLAWECQLHTSLARRPWYVGKLMFWALLDLCEGITDHKMIQKNQPHILVFSLTCHSFEPPCRKIKYVVQLYILYYIIQTFIGLNCIMRLYLLLQRAVYTLCGCMKLKNIQVVSQIMQIIKHAQYYKIQHCIYSENVLCLGNIV